MTPLYIRTVRLKTVSEDILSKDHDNISLITGFQCKGKHTVIDALPYQSDIRSDTAVAHRTLWNSLTLQNIGGIVCLMTFCTMIMLNISIEFDDSCKMIWFRNWMVILVDNRMHQRIICLYI